MRLSGHRRVSWPLTVKAVTNRRKNLDAYRHSTAQLKPKSLTYKASDRDGMCVTVSPIGTVTFRYDYRLNGCRETLTIGSYGPGGISLALAREKLLDAKKAVAAGRSPALEKQREKRRLTAAKNFGDVALKWLADAKMAGSTRAMRKHVVDRDILPVFRSRLLNEITADDLADLVQQGEGAWSACHCGACPRHREAGLCLCHSAWGEGGQPGQRRGGRLDRHLRAERPGTVAG
jgi:hypothetical protein